MAMDSELVEIAFPIVCVFLLGVVMFMGFRWPRKKSEEFQNTESSKTLRYSQEDKLILDQLKSKETWDKVEDGLPYHEPNSGKTNAIRNDVVGTLRTVPFVITTLIAVYMVFLYFFN